LSADQHEKAVPNLVDQNRAIFDMLLAVMNPHQRKKLDQLEDELGVTRGTLRIEGEREGRVHQCAWSHRADRA
jgi:hypothetical protein